MEKNPLKVGAADTPVVLSMSRLIVLGFAAGMLHQLWHVGIAGWPEAALAIAIVLALPILNALERSTPRHVLALAHDLVNRFGIGDVRRTGSAYDTEPSKFDDHTDDHAPRPAKPSRRRSTP